MAPLKLQVFTGSPGGFNVTSVLVSGEQDAILIDSQFLLSDAHRLVAMVLESGKRLAQVYVTHAHPDHYFGLGVVAAAFPDAQIVARASTIEEIRSGAPKKVAQWKPMAGTNIPDEATLPTPLAEPLLMLEGERLELTGDLQGDIPNNSFVWIPSIKAVVTGDILYNQAFVWTADSTAEQRQGWLKTIDAVDALGAEIVVAGHKNPAAPDDRAAIDHTRSYLQQFDEVAAAGHSPDEIMAEMKRRFPDLSTLEVALKLGANAAGRK